MRTFRYLLFLFALLGLVGFEWPFEFLTYHPNPETLGTRAWLDKQMKILQSQADNIDPKVLRLSLKAYIKARQKGYDNKQLLTVIDYSKSSVEKRLWVFDLKKGKALFNTWVSHGKNSGGTNSTSFSNQLGSLKSSLGVFVTTEPYIGSKGYSLRMKGLEPGVNDNAYKRDIVFHGAWYVDASTIQRYGQIGRSWGCPAVSTSTARSLIDTIKENTVVFAYYPDRSWLNKSQYLA